MAVAVQVHQVELVDQALPLEQVQRAVDRAAIDGSIERPRLAQNLAGIEMLAGRLDDAQNRAALRGHADSTLGKLRLQDGPEFQFAEAAFTTLPTSRN